MDKNKLLMNLNNKYDDASMEKISEAFDFACNAHEGQKRKSGQDYIIHPCAVAEILAELNLESSVIIAGLLHDVIEDTKYDSKDIEERFGEEIATLVISVTKLKQVDFSNREEQQADNLRKMFIAMAKDMRVIVIKLADRLHNMRTLEFVQPHKQLSIARETMDIFAPLAGRLGISSIKCELEDLSMKYIHSKEYKEIGEALNLYIGERKIIIDKTCEILRDKLVENSITGEVFGRQKHMNSIYRKMITQSKEVSEIYDLIAVRVIVKNVLDCYAMLGTIHDKWKPIPGRFKDYIAMPKPNMYQSLHTTVMTNFGSPVEIQIRTYEMHKIAEYGIAAHWVYKEGKPQANKVEEKFTWLRSMLEQHVEEKNSKEFLDTLKDGLYTDEVFVFTPKGDVYNLPINSTGIDFAYAIHSAIGNKCVGIKINDKIVPINATLQTGDIVSVLTSKTSKGPSRDWLKFVKTSSAKSKIKNFFRKENREDNIKQGRLMLERGAKRRGNDLTDLLKHEWVEKVMSKYNLPTQDDMFAIVGYGGLTCNQVLLKLIDYYKAENKTEAIIPKEVPLEQIAHREPKGSVIVKGISDIKIRLANCCNPVPGDKIIGFVSRGKGVTVHTFDCKNVQNFPSERIIEVEWVQGNKESFLVSIRVDANDRSGLMADVSQTFANSNISLKSATVNTKPNKKATIVLTVELADLATMDMIIKKLRELKDITAVMRTTRK